VGEEVENALVELARRLGVQHDGAERIAGARRDRHDGHRLELLLLELSEVLHARVVDRVLANERGRVVPQHPAGQPLVHAHVELADEMRVNLRRRLQSQAVAVAQVDEARVAVGRLAHQVDDRVEHAAEVRR